MSHLDKQISRLRTLPDKGARIRALYRVAQRTLRESEQAWRALQEQCTPDNVLHAHAACALKQIQTTKEFWL